MQLFPWPRRGEFDWYVCVSRGQQSPRDVKHGRRRTGSDVERPVIDATRGGKRSGSNAKNGVRDIRDVHVVARLGPVAENREGAAG